MIIETYNDGELIEVKEIEGFLSPNFLMFNNAMLNSDDYALIMNLSTHQLAKNRLELAAIRLELKTEHTDLDWQTFRNIWNVVVSAIPIESKSNINRSSLSIIAKNANMPFEFDTDLNLEFLAQ